MIDIQLHVQESARLRSSVTAPLPRHRTLELPSPRENARQLPQHHSLWLERDSQQEFGGPKRSLLPQEAWDRIHRCVSGLCHVTTTPRGRTAQVFLTLDSKLAGLCQDAVHILLPCK